MGRGQDVSLAHEDPAAAKGVLGGAHDGDHPGPLPRHCRLPPRHFPGEFSNFCVNWRGSHVQIVVIVILGDRHLAETTVLLLVAGALGEGD